MRGPRGEERREFRFGPVPLEEAVGKLLGHNVAGSDGRPALRKGRPLSPEDVALLRRLGRRVVYVAEPGTTDLDEDAAARRVAQSAQGPGLRLVGPGAGRANLVATGRGVLRVDASRLLRLNELEGITVATLPGHAHVREGQVVTTVKVIPFALPESVVLAAEEAAAQGGPLLRVDPILPRMASLLLCGSTPARERIVRDFEPPLRMRLEALGATIRTAGYVPLEDEAGEKALAAALRREVDQGAGLIVLGGLRPVERLVARRSSVSHLIIHARPEATTVEDLESVVRAIGIEIERTSFYRENVDQVVELELRGPRRLHDEALVALVHHPSVRSVSSGE